MMTSYSDVYDARGEVFSRLTRMLHMRPQAIGVVDVGGGEYGLKVSLPREPEMSPPVELDGVRIEYAVAEGPATLLGGGESVPEWRRRIRAAGR